MTACRLVAKNGIDLLIKAARQLATTIPDLRLVVVGDDKYLRRYEQHCTVHVIGNVHFAGRAPHAHIHDFYAACDIFILASRDSVNPFTGTRDVETMGRVLCDANAGGIPVIASRCGGIPSVITEGKTVYCSNSEMSGNCLNGFVACMQILNCAPSSRSVVLHVHKNSSTGR